MHPGAEISLSLAVFFSFHKCASLVWKKDITQWSLFPRPSSLRSALLFFTHLFLSLFSLTLKHNTESQAGMSRDYWEVKLQALCCRREMGRAPGPSFLLHELTCFLILNRQRSVSPSLRLKRPEQKTCVFSSLNFLEIHDSTGDGPPYGEDSWYLVTVWSLLLKVRDPKNEEYLRKIIYQ